MSEPMLVADAAGIVLDAAAADTLLAQQQLDQQQQQQQPGTATAGVAGSAVAAAAASLLQRRRSTRRQARLYTLDEVAKHTTRETGIWIAVHGNVYCVTNYLLHHPGGELTILGMAGKDCTDSWSVFHSKEVLDKVLPKYKIGELKDYAPTSMQQDLYAIIEKLEQDGKFETSYWWYTQKWLVQAALFSSVLIGLWIASSFWHYMIMALLLGTAWQQIAFLGHDYGHNSVSHSKDGDWPWSVLITLLFGVSGEWWKRSHNVHHILTNSITHDPDIQHLPWLAISNKIFKGFYSTYHNIAFKFTSTAKILVGIQHYMYWPIMLIGARFNLTIQSFLLCLDMRRDRNNRLIDLGALLGYVSIYCWMMSCLPDWFTVICFTSLSNAVAGFVHIQITLSHFGMDAYHGPGYDDPDHFVKNQFMTTMDIDCPQWMDWFHGGLQFQLVHHLMPRLPRHNLRYARDTYVKDFAARHGLKYCLYSFVEGNKLVLRVLREVATEARSWPNGPSGKLSTFLNAEG